MIYTISNQLIALCIAAIVNILLGMYYNINLDECHFETKKFLQGFIKAGIVIISFIGMAYCFEVTDLSVIGVTPELVINSALILYVTKAMQNLIKILGIDSLSSKINTGNNNG